MDVSPVLALLPSWVRLTLLTAFFLVKGVLFGIDTLSTLLGHRRKPLPPVTYRCQRELQFRRCIRSRTKYSK